MLVPEQNFSFRRATGSHFLLGLYLTLKVYGNGTRRDTVLKEAMKFHFRRMPAGWAGALWALCVLSGECGAVLDVLPGMPPLLDPNNVYAAAAPGEFAAAVKGFPARVYVPNSKSD